MQRLPVPAGVRPAPPLRPAARRGILRGSALLILAALVLPLAMLPLGRLVPTLETEATELAAAAAAAASRIAAALPAPATAAPDAAAIVAVLAAGPPAKGVTLALLGPAGEVVAGAMPTAGTSPFLAAEQAVTGAPYRVLAMRAAPPPREGLLPLGAAMLAMLLLALLAYRREAQAHAVAAAEERRDAQRTAALAESEAQLRLALGAAELGCWSWDEGTDRVTWDAEAAAILDWYPAEPVSAAALRDHVEPADRPLMDAAMARARRSGEPAHCALRLRTPPGIRPRWIELRAQAQSEPGGATWHGVIADITARRRAEEEQRLLLREVDHRAKNTLAVVQALLRLTRTEDPANFLPRVEARIGALARAHTLLAQARWQGAGLQRLAEAELVRYRAGGARLTLSGPMMVLAATAVQPIAMVLHELASNAASFGALAQPGAALSLTWRPVPQGGLDLVWQEHLAAPLPEAPAQKGFGIRILEATVQDQLGGRIERNWTPEGLRCVIHLPSACLRPAEAQSQA
ncbi:MAG: HWE histidine kinase domain-containing protein [Paracraurococcus sp.]